MTFEHSGKWIEFDDYFTFGVVYCMCLPAAIYLKAIDNGSITKPIFKTTGFIIMFILLGVWIFGFFYIWMPIMVIVLIIWIKSILMEDE